MVINLLNVSQVEMKIDQLGLLKSLDVQRSGDYCDFLCK